MTGDRFVICMRWGRAYGPDYVNVLHNACRKAMRGAFRFVCLTDDPAGFVPGIEALPVPDIGLAARDWFRPGVWPKIALYDRHFHGLRGRALFIDLDMVVVDDLDRFFVPEAPFVGLDCGPAWGRRGRVEAPPVLGTGIFAFDLGAFGPIADGFRADPEAMMARFRQEQQYVQTTLPALDYWPDDWVISFKRSLRRPMGIDLFVPPRAPPPGAKVVAFHGTPRPIDLLQPGRRFWDRFPHLGNGRVPWLADYWQGNGGRLPG